MNTIILTASIPRGGEFYSRSLGSLFKYFNFLNIKVNLDDIEKLRDLLDESYRGLCDIVGKKNVRRNDGKCGFLDAFKWLTKDCEDYAYVWWMEDDWKFSGKIEYLSAVIDKCSRLKCKAFSFCDNAPMGSFKAGPLMDQLYFSKYFNISKYMNNTCDPEKQYKRWVKGGLRDNGRETINRIVCEGETINLIFFFTDLSLMEKYECFDWYYMKDFNPGIKFRNWKFPLDISIGEFYEKIPLGEVYYITLVPGLFSDIGRDFAKKRGLLKWETESDKTTYKCE